MREALAVDLYEMTMCQSYLLHGFSGQAIFELFVRALPGNRNYLIACGLDTALSYLETLRFSREHLAYLKGIGLFDAVLLDWLESFRFSGDVHAVAEGTPVFAGEPILQIVAPLPEAQLVESMLLNLLSFQTLVASKASRIVEAAAGRRVVDFGMRRAHGVDAAVLGARAAFVAGVDATSNVLAAQTYGLPVAGTMAHSYVQAFEREADAFETFAVDFPQTVLLVDTYDSLGGVDQVIALAARLGPRFRVRGVRLDSGDLAELARGARRRLDEAGLTGVEIIVSSGLDEDAIADLRQAPIDVFGVGTKMLVAADRPHLDSAYKLVSYDGIGRIKLSPGKILYPGRKQVYRRTSEGTAEGDAVVLAEREVASGTPLLRLVMEAGRRTADGSVALADARSHAARSRRALPEAVRGLTRAHQPYPVTFSAGLELAREAATRRAGG